MLDWLSYTLSDDSQLHLAGYFAGEILAHTWAKKHRMIDEHSQTSSTKSNDVTDVVRGKFKCQ